MVSFFEEKQDPGSKAQDLTRPGPKGPANFYSIFGTKMGAASAKKLVLEALGTCLRNLGSLRGCRGGPP